jgi:hypothetical protein
MTEIHRSTRGPCAQWTSCKPKQKTQRWTRTRSGLPNLSGVALMNSSVIHLLHPLRSAFGNPECKRTRWTWPLAPFIPLWKPGHHGQHHSDALHDGIRFLLPGQHNRRVSNRRDLPHCLGLAVLRLSPSIPPAIPTQCGGSIAAWKKWTQPTQQSNLPVSSGKRKSSARTVPRVTALKIAETSLRQTVLLNDPSQHSPERH